LEVGVGIVKRRGTLIVGFFIFFLDECGMPPVSVWSLTQAVPKNYILHDVLRRPTP